MNIIKTKRASLGIGSKSVAETDQELFFRLSVTTDFKIDRH